eukprot:Em0008g499a
MQTPHSVLGRPLDGACVTTAQAIQMQPTLLSRPNGTQYSLVSGSSSNYSVSPIMSGYNCSHFLIPQSQQFVVQQGDVIATCVQSSGSRRVGIVATASGSLRAQLYTRTPSIPCGSPLPSTIPQANFATRSITLHVSLDINECAVNNGGCNQTCVGTDVGYNCSCFSGFQLASDMKNCTPIGIIEVFICRRLHMNT